MIATINKTRRRCETEKRINPSIIILSSLLRPFGSVPVLSHFAFQQSRLERKAALAHYAFAGPESADDSLVSARGAAYLYIPRLETPRGALFGQKDDCALVDALDSLFGDDQLLLRGTAGGGRTGFEAHFDEHSDLEPLFPVCHFNSYTRRARLLAQHGIDVGHAPCDHSIAERRRPHFGGRAHAEGANLRLRDVGDDPERRNVGDGEE